MAYLLDANVFIRAKNLHYGLDFCPAFWEWLIQSNTAKQVFSIERVGDEFEAGDDDLAAWAAKRRPSFFLRPDPTIVPALGTVSSWATGQRYEPAAVSTFLQVADYYRRMATRLSRTRLLPPRPRGSRSQTPALASESSA